eukprot:3549297-Amphidinium_carterae.1
MGQRAGARHESVIPLAIWCVEQALSGHDIVFHECVKETSLQKRNSKPKRFNLDTDEGFNADLLDIAFGPEWLRLTINDDPSLHGWPVRRVRQFSCMLNCKSCQWLGPQASKDIQREYDQLFHVTRVADAREILLASNEEKMQALSELAQRRGVVLPKDISDPDFISTDSLLAAAQARRLREYTHKRTEQVQRRESLMNASFLADLEQNPSAVLASGLGVVPTMLTHGLVWVQDREHAGRPMTASERLACQGVDVFNLGFGCPFDVSKLPVPAVKKLSGNAFHLHAWSCWLLYCFANVSRES